MVESLLPGGQQGYLMAGQTQRVEIRRWEIGRFEWRVLGNELELAKVKGLSLAGRLISVDSVDLCGTSSLCFLHRELPSRFRIAGHGLAWN